MRHDLMTPRGEKCTGTPWDVYPRPQLRRDNWLNLNGQWEFSAGEETFDRTILVPFCPESKLSGIGQHFPEGTPLYYRRKVTLPAKLRRGRLLLHIGAADQVTDVWVNDVHMGSHEGGYDAFTFDITRARDRVLEILICCVDNLKDSSFPYGKQTMNRGGMWYTPVSGIWQTVWLESVPEVFIPKLNIINQGYSVTIDTKLNLPGTVTVADLGTFPLKEGKVTIRPPKPRLWSPEDPYLYRFTVTVGEDRVASYFAIRYLEIRQVGKYPRLCLNGKPYFFHGLLDQGYWPESLLTAPTPGSYADDILAMKRLGFNTLRKHIKVEPEIFYYQCDMLGMIVWQDMVNNGDYHFLRDTALPTLGIQRKRDKNLHRDSKSRRRFRKAAKAAVKQLRNHPCICAWTIFNEGWGQFDSDDVSAWFEKLDSTRFIDATSGWFRQKNSQLDSRHVYFRKVRLKGDGIVPLVLSEFGGKTWKVEGHVMRPEKTYGYGNCETRQELNQAVQKLYMDEVIPCIPKGLCAAIYTQVSDVEDEINGVLTYDRKVCKLKKTTMLPVAETIKLTVAKLEGLE